MKRFLPTNSVRYKTSGRRGTGCTARRVWECQGAEKKNTLASQLGAFPSTEQVLSTQQLHGSTWGLQRVPAMGSVLLAEPVPEAAGWIFSV